MFRVGQKVTQIKPFTWPTTKYQETVPIYGAVYTIRAINIVSGIPFLHFMEVRNGAYLYGSEFHEMDFAARWFRPIVEKKTDISFAHEILRRATKREWV